MLCIHKEISKEVEINLKWLKWILAGEAQYADARLIENETETLGLQNGTMQALESSKNLGIGLRVVVGGAWGFASSLPSSYGRLPALRRLSARR